MGTYTGHMYKYVFSLPFFSGIFAKEEKKQQGSHLGRVDPVRDGPRKGGGSTWFYGNDTSRDQKLSTPVDCRNRINMITGTTYLIITQ